MDAKQFLTQFNKDLEKMKRIRNSILSYCIAAACVFFYGNTKKPALKKAGFSLF